MTGIGLLYSVFSPVIERLLFMPEFPFCTAAAFFKIMLWSPFDVKSFIIGLPVVTKAVIVFTLRFFKTPPAFKSLFPAEGIAISSGLSVRMTGHAEGF